MFSVGSVDRKLDEAIRRLRAQRTYGLAFVLIEPVSSGGPNELKEEAGSLMLQAVSSNDTNVKTPDLQSIVEAIAVLANKR